MLHESRDDEHAGFDLLGFLTLTGGLFALVLALLRGDDWAGRAGESSGSSAQRSRCSPRSSSSEWRTRGAMFDVALFRKPAFAGAQIIAFVVSAGMFAQVPYLTLYLQNTLRYSPIETGLRFSHSSASGCC